MSKGLDMSAIAGILAADKKQAATKKATGKRRTKDRTEPRTFETWWTFFHSLGNCSNPECKDVRPHKVEEGNTMVAEINGKDSCRYCFLDGYNRTEGLDSGEQVV